MKKKIGNLTFELTIHATYRQQSAKKSYLIPPYSPIQWGYPANVLVKSMSTSYRLTQSRCQRNIYEIITQKLRIFNRTLNL